VQPPPALCYHPGHCGTIPGAIEPCSDGAPPRQALCSTNASISKTLEATLPGECKRRHDTCEGQDTIKSQALHADTTILYENPSGTSVSRLPLPYKRRRWSPGCRGYHFSFALIRKLIPLILALRLNHLAGTWRLFLLSHAACSPPLQEPRCIAIKRTIATCWTYVPVAGTRIILSSHFLALAIDTLITAHFTI
jgi:hypothetical protein